MGGFIRICDYMWDEKTRVRKVATVQQDGYIFIDEARDVDGRRVTNNQIVLNAEEAKIFLDELNKIKEL